MLGSGRPGFPQDFLVTSQATLTQLVTVLTQITQHHATCHARAGPAPPGAHTNAIRQNVRVKDPAETGTHIQVLRCAATTPRRDARRSVEGTWCDSHTMASAVCISNTSNSIDNHSNCSPGWRTCWVPLPQAATSLRMHMPGHPNLQAAQGTRKFYGDLSRETH